MVSVPQIKHTYERMLQLVGEVVTLRRYTGTGTNRPRFDAAVRARVEGYRPDALTGTIQQGDRHLIMLADDLFAAQFPLPILTSDKVVVRGRELQIIATDDSTRRVQGQLIAIELQARG